MRKLHLFSITVGAALALSGCASNYAGEGALIGAAGVDRGFYRPPQRISGQRNRAIANGNSGNRGKGKGHGHLR